MKIVYINGCDNGSTGKIVRDIIEELPSNMAGQFYVGRKTTKIPYIHLLHTKLEYRFHQLLSMVLDRDEIGSKYATKKLIKNLIAIKPDIIHLHNLHGYYINYKLLFDYIKKYEVKTIWTLHDCWAFSGHCSYFDFVGCQKWKTGCNNCVRLKDYPKSLLFDRSKSLYKIKKSTFCGVQDMTIITPSIWLANLAKQSYLGSYDIKVINNGINLDNFKPSESKMYDNIISRDKKVILGVASGFGERKGYKDFLELAKIIDERYIIVMVGLNKEQIKALPKNIVGIESTQNQVQLAYLYSLANVFINLTYEDNYPTVNIEALACGTPVITYRTGGSIETIKSFNGAVVEQGSVSAVWEKIKEFENINFEQQKIILDATQNYSRKTMAKNYITLYNSRN